MEQSEGSTQALTNPEEQHGSVGRFWLPALLLLVVVALLFRIMVLRARATPPETDLLHGNGEEAPGALAERLAGTPSQQQLPLLLKYTQDHSYGLRYAAIDALDKRHDPGVADMIEQAFRDSDSEVRKRAMEILPNVDTKRGLHLLLAGLRDEDSWIRERAATELNLFAGPRGKQPPALYKNAVPMLMTAIDDPDGDVAHTAIDVLRKLTGQPWHISRLAPLAERQAVATKWHRWWDRAESSWPVAAEYANVPPIVPTRTDPCPDFSLHRLDGKELTLQSQKGRITLLNFFGVGCGPCEAETQTFVDLDQKYRARNVDVIGVAVGQEDDVEQLRNWIRKNHVLFPQALSNPEAQRAFGHIEDVPVTVLIDPQGRICNVWEGGPRGPEPFSAAIERLLK